MLMEERGIFVKKKKGYTNNKSNSCGLSQSRSRINQKLIKKYIKSILRFVETKKPKKTKKKKKRLDENM